MKSNLYLTLLGVALLAAPAVFGQATSGVVGFSTKTVSPGTSIVVPTLVNASVFQGSVTISSDGLTITPSSAPGWTANAYRATTFSAPTPNYPTHYAEIVSGTHEGLLLDISSNSTTALSLVIAAPSVVWNTTQQIAIRPHITLSKIVEGSTGLAPGDDVVTIFDASTGGRRDFTYVGGTNFSASGLSANHTPVYPGNGVIFNATDTVTLNFMGEVKPTKTQVALWSTGTNVVGPMNPASGTLLYGNSLATLLAPGDDVITVYSTNGQMVPSNYTTNGAAIGNSGGPLAPSATDAIPLNSGAVITVADPLTWIVRSPLNP
ncbi:MAG: hypothetical protein U1F81_08555 [Verrucomicrobiaceae bacterium]